MRQMTELSWDDLRTHEGALEAVLIIAERWRVLDIPRGQQVEIAGYVIADDVVVTEGLVHVGAAHGTVQGLNVYDCTFVGGTLVGTAECLISIAQRQLAAEEQAEAFTERRTRTRSRRGRRFSA
jgi:hypothetical protein